MATLVFFFLFLAGVRTDEVATPASLLRPRNFNHHAHGVEQYLKELKQPKPTKQGPVLFPNDAPPPPRPPLIVTSRPLIESIARSELNPVQDTNNSIAESSQINRVSVKPNFLAGVKPGFRLKPGFLARVKNYKPYTFPLGTTVSPLDLGPYADVVKKARVIGAGSDNRYSDYEEQTALPPIYKALADHAQHKVLKIHQKPLQHYNYQAKEPDYPDRYQNTQVHHNDASPDYDQGQNYAFSYTVRDRETGDDFSHSQQSSGSATNGEYRVRLPDGRMQIVSYTADENGYKADVRYDEDKIAGNSIDNRNYNPSDYQRDQNDYNRKQNHQNRDKSEYNRDQNEYKHNYNHNHVDYSTNQNDYNDNDHDYVQNVEYRPTETNINYKTPIEEDYNQYSDLSKEYNNNDYSLEYDGKYDNYEPHRSKFTSFVDNKNRDPNLGVIIVPNRIKNKNFAASTVKPSYDELKPLFVTKKFYNAQPTANYYKNPVEYVSSTTVSPNIFDTTEHVVVIGTNKPKLYTNIKNIPLTATPTPLTLSNGYVTPSNSFITPSNSFVTPSNSFVTPSNSFITPSYGLSTPSNRFISPVNDFVTPRNYLASTIASLKNGAKPALTKSFIDRINKYLTFK